jgi:hypothetical protein
MTNREKIIVGMAVLAVAYGAIEILMPRAKPAAPVQTSKGLEGLTAFISKVADAARGGLGDANASIIQKAEAAWKQNPFLKIARPQPSASVSAEAPKGKPRPAPSLAYSGFIDVGERRLAIINGLEYETGDRLEPEGLTVKTILPNKVILVYTQGGGAPVVISLKEHE